MPKISKLDLKYDGNLVQNDDFDVLRLALFESAGKHDAYEAAYALLYRQTSYRTWYDKEERRLTADEYEQLIECDDFLLWQTLQRSSRLTEYNEAAAALIAKLALPDLKAFHTAVENWGTRIHFDAMLRLAEAQESSPKPSSFKDYARKLQATTKNRFETAVAHSSRKAKGVQSKRTSLPEFSDQVAQHIIDRMELEGYTLEPLTTHYQFYQDYATYCYGFNGDPRWMASGGDRKLMKEDYAHVFRISYHGTILFWLWTTPTFQRCRWDERVITDDTRSLKRSLGGKINHLRQDTRMLQEIE